MINLRYLDMLYCLVRMMRGKVQYRFVDGEIFHLLIVGKITPHGAVHIISYKP